MNSPKEHLARLATNRWFIGLLGIFLLVAGAFFYQSQEQAVRRNVDKQLQAIANLKIGQVVQWRTDRINDARDVMTAVFLYEAIDKWLTEGEESDHQRIVQRLRAIQVHQNWLDVIVVDATGRVRLSLSGTATTMHDKAALAFETAMRDHQPQLSAPHAGPGDIPGHLDVITPLFAKDGRPIGAVILQASLKKSLYPLVQEWPVDSQTAEALLGIKDGENALYLNDLRHTPDTGLKLHIPLTDQTVPLVMAIHGQRGMVEGHDYRGADVLALLAQIPDSDWFLVAKIDKDEALADWHARSQLLLALIVLLSGITVTSLTWVRHSTRQSQTLTELEHELRERMLELNSILDNSSVGIVFVRDRKQIWVNGRMGEIFGYTVEAMRGKETRMFYPSEEDYTELGHEAYPILEKGERYTCEQLMQHHDGRLIWVRISGKLVDLGNPNKGSIWVFEDIARQKMTEQALIKASAVAEAANIAKSRFLATMSHELRTPMNGILGMAQMLLMPDINAGERLDYARTILNSGHTLLALLNDILDLSKVEAGKLELETAVYQPAQVLHEIKALFNEAARAKNLELELDWSGPEYQRYTGDPHRLRQMLSNLVNNAIKFTAQGIIRIEASEVTRDDKLALLEFAITDTGIGIPEDKQALLFKPFSQTDSSNTRQYGGTGLGLSIVRSLARLMGGDVGVDSEAGKGSRFWFRIHTKLISATEDARHSQRVSQRDSVSSTEQLKGNVLVVEDNPTNRKVISSLLAKLGLNVSIAEDGQQAVVAITQSGAQPNLILMDVQMPIMDGYTATKQIRQWEQENGRARLTIIALTADAFAEDRQRCMNAGMDDFLAKPVALDALRTVLAQWLLSAEP